VARSKALAKVIEARVGKRGLGFGAEVKTKQDVKVGDIFKTSHARKI